MTDARRLELMQTLLGTMIADLGYPVGCGVQPHPKTLRKMAEYAIKVARDQSAKEQT